MSCHRRPKPVGAGHAGQDPHQDAVAAVNDPDRPSNCEPQHAVGLGGAACRNRTDDLLITRRKVTVTSAVFRRDSLQGTYLRCPYFSSVSGSSLHEWLHAAATTPPSAGHSDPRSGAVCTAAGVNPDHYRVRAHEGPEATAPVTAGSTVAVTSWAVTGCHLSIWRRSWHASWRTAWRSRVRRRDCCTGSLCPPA